MYKDMILMQYSIMWADDYKNSNGNLEEVDVLHIVTSKLFLPHECRLFVEEQYELHAWDWMIRSDNTLPTILAIDEDGNKTYFGGMVEYVPTFYVREIND